MPISRSQRDLLVEALVVAFSLVADQTAAAFTAGNLADDFADRIASRLRVGMPILGRDARAPTSPFLNQREAATYTGRSISSLRRARAAGLPFARVGGNVEFERAVLDLWMRGEPISGYSEPKSEDAQARAGRARGPPMHSDDDSPDAPSLYAEIHLRGFSPQQIPISMNMASMVRTLIALLSKAVNAQSFASFLTLSRVSVPASPSILIQQAVDAAVLLRAVGFDLDADIGASFEKMSDDERTAAYRSLQPYMWLFDEMATLAAMVHEHVEWLNPNPDGVHDLAFDSAD